MIMNCEECPENCCRLNDICLTHMEFENLSQKYPILLRMPYVRFGPFFHFHKCPFFLNNRCQIYDDIDRPLVCRIFPVVSQYGKDFVSFCLTPECWHINLFKNIPVSVPIEVLLDKWKLSIPDLQDMTNDLIELEAINCIFYQFMSYKQDDDRKRYILKKNPPKDLFFRGFLRKEKKDYLKILEQRISSLKPEIELFLLDRGYKKFKKKEII